VLERMDCERRRKCEQIGQHLKAFQKFQRGSTFTWNLGKGIVIDKRSD